MLGGQLSNSVSANVYSMEVDGSTWKKLQPMNVPRYLHTCSVYNGQIYAMGGWEISSVEIYQPATNTWRMGPQLPSALDDGLSFVHDQVLYIIYTGGDVYKLTGTDTSASWEKVTKIESYGSRKHSALVVTKEILKCN